MLLVACAIFVPRLKGDTAGHINSSHRGETLRDERPYLYLSSETHKGLSFCFHRMKNSARPPNVPGGGGTPIHYLYGYVPPNGVVILKLLI